MNKKIITLFVLGSCVVALGVTNILVTITLPEAKHTNLIAVAEKNLQTVDQYITSKVMRDIEDERIGVLLTMWQSASLEQQENAYKALTNAVVTPP